MEVHLEVRFTRKYARLPVLIEVLRLDRSHGLYFHSIESERGDVVHSLDNRPSLAGQRNPGRT